MNNPMLVAFDKAFDKCLVEMISDPMPPPTNWTPYSNIQNHVDSVCKQRLFAGFKKCFDEVMETMKGFSDVMEMMTESHDLK